MREVSIYNSRVQTPWGGVRFAQMARKLPEGIQTHTFDAIVVGGAINGSGEARDLARRGASVLVLHKQDPQKATNNSSRLGHGGLRYLPHFEFGLVRESRQELANLLRNAPHLVRPLSMIVPVYQGDPHPRWLVGMGLKLYDWFVKKGVLPKHQRLSPDDLCGNLAKGKPGIVPGLRREGLVGGFQYYDTQIAYPERVCIENFRDALEQATPKQPVHVVGHTEVTRIEEKPDHVLVSFQDQLDGKTYQARAKYLINTTGSAVDKIVDRTETPYSVKRPQMGPTKGTHILVANKTNLMHTVYSPATDGRPFFIIPFPVVDPQKPAKYLLIGTTDDKTWTSEYPTREEVDYLVKSANRAVPGINLEEKDIYTAYSGFRPLPASNKNAGAVTRRHIIRRVGNSRIFHIIGGKITTFRSLSEQVGDEVIAALKKEPDGAFSTRMKDRGKCTTATQPLPGGRGIHNIEAYKREQVLPAAQEYDISPEVVTELIDRYGSRYREVLDLTRPDPTDLAKGPHLKASLTPGAPLILAQALHAIRYEQAETLMDIMTESLKMDLLPGAGLDAAEAAINILAQEKPPFTEEEKAQELATYRSYVASNQQWHQQQG